MTKKSRGFDLPGLKTTRRGLLRGFALAGVTIPLLSWLSSSKKEAQASEARADFNVFHPTFSVKERDRRWAAIRQIMAKAQWNLDAILAPATGDKAYPRYLTQIGGRGGSAEVILTRDDSKPVYALAGSSRNKRFWEARLESWRSGGILVIEEGAGSKQAAQRLKALGLDRRGTRIGVAKLTGSRFDPEGLVSLTYVENLKAALPGIQFLPIEKWGPDSGPIDEVAMVKSAEEHEVIRRCVTVGEKAIETIRRTARPPARHQGDIWFQTFNVMFADTGEDPTRLSISIDSESNSTLGAPTADPLKPGQIISQEIDATVQGYRAQVNHSIFVGGPATPGFEYYRAAMETAIKVFLESLAFIVPGKTTCGQLVDHYAAVTDKLNAEDRSGVVLHSSGIGNLSRPRLGPSNSRKDSDIVIVPGMTFNFKPAIRMKRSALQDVVQQNRIVQLGGHLLITESGAVHLGKRELKPLATEG